MKNQKELKMKRIGNLTLMFMLVVFGFFLLVADSQGEGVQFSFDDRDLEEVHENFSLTGEVYHYSEGDKRDVKDGEVSIDLKVFLSTYLKDENGLEEINTKEIYVKENYPISINERSFKMDFDIEELQIKSEYDKLKATNDLNNEETEAITVKLEFTIRNYEESYTIRLIDFRYSPKSE